MSTHPHDPFNLGYRFCPRCAGALETKVAEAHDPRERLVCSRCGFIFYIDPKVAVGTIVREERGFLLLKRAIEPARGKWTFPGGYVTLEQAAVREALEETGVEIELDRLVNVYSYARRGIVMIIYEGIPVSGEPRPTAESLETRWIRSRDLPWTELAFPSTRSALRDYFLRHGLGDLVPDDWTPGAEF
jgi:8-oxo-dGTP diphosphatase